VGDDSRHVELHAVQVELAAAARNFALHGRAEIVDVELCDLLRILSGLDVDVPELHCHARFLSLRISPRRAEVAPAAAAWQHEQRNSTDIRQTAGVFESRIAPLTGLDDANCRRPQPAHRSGSTSSWARLIGGGYRWLARSVPTARWRRLRPTEPLRIVLQESCSLILRRNRRVAFRCAMLLGGNGARYRRNRLFRPVAIATVGEPHLCAMHRVGQRLGRRRTDQRLGFPCRPRGSKGPWGSTLSEDLA